MNKQADSNFIHAVEPFAVPIIGITMGDPAGIGPEIVLKALAMESWKRNVCP